MRVENHTSDHGEPQRALWLPLFDELADPRIVAKLAADAESAGWDGVFVWDHVNWHHPIRDVADPWITLAAIATATNRIRLGAMVTPLARRRPAKVARETATLDLLSNGRLIIGAGLGSDRFGGEFSKTGEQVGDRERAQMLDESLEILTRAWSGEPVNHHSDLYTIDELTFLPRPVQRPSIPIWTAGMAGSTKPLRRAAKYDGYFPVNLEHPSQLREAISRISEFRQNSSADYAVAAAVPVDEDTRPWADAGATWILTEFAPGTTTIADVQAVIDRPIAR